MAIPADIGLSGNFVTKCQAMGVQHWSQDTALGASDLRFCLLSNQDPYLCKTSEVLKIFSQFNDFTLE